ncbi:MAG: adenylate/guanylate cyclase domain-containing protein [Candidatus Cloacimonetes bacterium]|nr:adenylate/guanylate cyclase domain-containing protein [Candidatus Cloacimonadota bacterium]
MQNLELVRGESLYLKLVKSILTPLGLVFLLAMILISVLEYRLYSQDALFRMEKLKESVRERLLAVGRTAAISMDMQKHSEIFSYNDKDLPEFKSLKQYLNQIRMKNGIEEHLYTLRLTDPDRQLASFVVMTNQEDYVGTQYIYPDSMNLTFFLGLEQTTDIYKSKSLEGKSWMSAFIPLREPGEDEYSVLEVDISVENLLEKNREISRMLIFFHVLRGIVLLVLFVLVFYLISNILRGRLNLLLVKPLYELMNVLKRVGTGDLKVESSIRSGDEIEVLSDAFNEMVLGLRQKETMGRFLTGMEMKEVMAVSESGKELALTGEKRQITILFSDIRDFTTICEDADPEVIILALNTYFAAMISEIESQHGTLDKLIGDAVMAVFEEEEGLEPSGLRAARCAWAMQQVLKDLRPQMVAKGWPEFRIGIGLNTGIAVVGNVGSQNTLSRTVLGDCVNLAARIESLSKNGKHSCILLADNVNSVISTHFATEFLMETVVKGKSVPVRIFEIRN